MQRPPSDAPPPRPGCRWVHAACRRAGGTEERLAPGSARQRAAVFQQRHGRRARSPKAAACAEAHSRASRGGDTHLQHGDRLALLRERHKPHLRGLARRLWQRGVVHGIARCLDICEVTELLPTPASRSRRCRSRHPARESLSARGRAALGTATRNWPALPAPASRPRESSARARPGATRCDTRREPAALTGDPSTPQAAA